MSLKLQEEPAMWWEVGAVWLHLSTGAETFLGGKLGVFGELNAGQGGLSSWEGKSKGNESRDSSIQELIIPPFSLPFLLLLFILLEFIRPKLKGPERRNARTQLSSSVG